MPDELHFGPHRICETCGTPHVENCPSCFGFGLFQDGHAVFAEEADRIRVGEIIEGKTPVRCPDCGCGVRGLAKFHRITMEAVIQRITTTLPKNKEHAREELDELIVRFLSSEGYKDVAFAFAVEAKKLRGSEEWI